LTHPNDQTNQWITKKKEFRGSIRIRRGHNRANHMITTKGAKPIPFHEKEGHALQILKGEKGNPIGHDETSNCIYRKGFMNHCGG
jgi:hypothetical protein